MPQYEVMSTERYVDSTSHKTGLDKVLDELRSISRDTLSWDVLRMTQKHCGGTQEEDAQKLEAFLGAFIVGAVTELFDKGLEDAALRQLDQARTVLEARQKLKREVESIRSRTEEAAFDVSDLLGLFDEGSE